MITTGMGTVMITTGLGEILPGNTDPLIVIPIGFIFLGLTIGGISIIFSTIKKITNAP